MARSRAPRRITFVKAKMRQDLEWVEVGVGNVSATGMMVKCESPPPVGALVEIAHRSTNIKGRVVWATRSRFGLRSSEPIDSQPFVSGSALAPKSNRPAPERPRIWHWSVRRDPPGG